MSKPRHRMLEVDEAARRGVCAVCGPVEVKRKTNTSRGIRWACRNAERRWGQSQRQRPYAQIPKGDTCERCGFVAEVPQQLDLHHLDGDRTNNDPANFATLCANCHRWVHADGPAVLPRARWSSPLSSRA